MSDSPESETGRLTDSMKENLHLSPAVLFDNNFKASNFNEEARDGGTEPVGGEPKWKGVGMEEIRKGSEIYGREEIAPIVASPRHTVLFALPLTGQGPPEPYPARPRDKWSPGYVRMPHSPQSVYPCDRANGSKKLRQRWEIIQEALLRAFVSTHELEAAVLSYNRKYAQRWDFSALHHFFSDVLDDDDVATIFCNGLLPKIIELALQLPALVTGPVPLLRRHANAALSLSQLQVGSLLANAFLCTFPRRNSTNPQSEYAMYPEINFNRLFGACDEDRSDRSESVTEKLKCLFHYFRRITSKVPDGAITIQRRYIPRGNCPRWDRQEVGLPPLHITSDGTIETEGAGLLQVDFANKYVGGGVLGWGCVQEEIRFVICPELMASMLVAEALDDTEALLIGGVERYSTYEGYGETFKWTGDFVDETPRDGSGRRRTTVVAIDALLFKQSRAQFTAANVIRELNKAYVGFVSPETPENNLSAVATGNWGCGAFKGDPRLKALLQLMAAAVAGRPMVYFTFGDIELRDRVAGMYRHLRERNIDVGQLFTLVCEHQTYGCSNSQHSYADLYDFLYKRSKIKSTANHLGEMKCGRKDGDEANGESCEIGSSAESDSLRNNLDSSIGFTSVAKRKGDTERRNVENWPDDDSFDADFSAGLIPETSPDGRRIGTVEVGEHDGRKIVRVGGKVRKFEHVDETDDSDDGEPHSGTTAGSLKANGANDSKSLLFPRNERARDTDGVKKPRLSGLELLGRKQTCAPLEEPTTDRLAVAANNPNGDIGVTKSRQKKISDFFARS